MRARHLHDPLRCFCLAAFAALGREDAELPFAFEAHGAPGRPPLYEYRPLVRAFVDARERHLTALPDAAIALAELRREPAAAIFARAHAGPRAGEEEALARTVLLPLVVSVAEACGGFDWSDAAFARAYAELEVSLFRGKRAYAAVAPVIGLEAGAQVDLGGGIRLRPAATGELSAHWPEADGLLPSRFGRELDRLCVLELERQLPARESEPPDAPAELADAVTALRLATAAPVAAGPVLFERLDWRPFGVRPVLPIAATQPPGEPARLDQLRGALARDLRGRLGRADDDAELGEALDRWELSLFGAEAFRAEQLRQALAALLGGGDGDYAAALRAAMLLGEAPRERGRLLERLRTSPSLDEVRRALVEAVLHDDRSKLLAALDESLLGLRPRPAAASAAGAVGPSAAAAPRSA